MSAVASEMLPGEGPAGTAVTYFAPAERHAPHVVASEAKTIGSVAMLKEAIDAMPSMVLILNEHRQIVAANAAFLSVVAQTIDVIGGQRPGEAVGCIRAKEGPQGCGTAKHCITCGAVNAILGSQRSDAKASEECRILVQAGNSIVAMDLRVTCTPFRLHGTRFIMAVIEDISRQKRLEVLQRTFFHDVLNTAGCIKGYADFVAAYGNEDPEMCPSISRLTGQLIEAVQAQRDLTHAEAGDLQLRPERVRVGEMLESLQLQYAKHPIAKGRKLILGQVSDSEIVTDRKLLHRVLENMVKNALEATAEGNSVTLACEETVAGQCFSVHNCEVMRPEVQLQLFQRSFSTKSEAGHGVGTYSMKLLGEQYLRGKVAFTSQEPQGTTFRLTLPKMLA